MTLSYYLFHKLWEAEQKTAMLYEKLENKVKDPELRKFFADLKEDEYYHARLVENTKYLWKELPDDSQASKNKMEEVEDFLNFIDETLRKIDAKEEVMRTESLEIVYKIEVEMGEFHLLIMDRVEDPQLNKLLRALSSYDKIHVGKIKKKLEESGLI